ncbi:hypothetical protein Lal_00025725 [Lupinus albus]|nr:hypothetical protein Lal_00025725 [Lupinus albus]
MTSQTEENELVSQTPNSQKRTSRGVTSMKNVIRARSKNVRQNVSLAFSYWTDVRLNSVNACIWPDITLEKSDAPSDAVDLDVLWMDARKNKECVIDNEQVQEVANRVVSLKERVGLLQTPDSQVVLDKALVVLEYSRRIWGAGFWGINTYKLFLDIPSWRLVGVCKVHNTSDATMHNACIPPNHVKVAIDIAIYDDALLPIRIDEDIITLIGAICTYVAWPVYLVDVVPTMEKGIVEHSSTSPPRVKHASKKDKVVKSKIKENKSRFKSS